MRFQYSRRIESHPVNNYIEHHSREISEVSSFTIVRNPVEQTSVEGDIFVSFNQ